SVTSFGEVGPYRDFRLYPSQTSHAGGAAYLLPDGFAYEPEKDLPPSGWPGYASDYASGLQAAVAALSALFAARLTGRGDHVDLSKQQAQMHSMRYAIDAYPNAGIVEKRRNSEKPAGTVDRSGVSGTYPCLDGYVALWPSR